MNKGKQFESSLRKSATDTGYVMVYRLADAAQSFGGSNNLRFSRKNPFDFFFFDAMRGILYGIEAKTVQGKSISFERNKSEQGIIHYHQIQGLNEYNTKEYSQFERTCFGFIIEFREIEKTIFIKIEDFDQLISSIEKKSFNYNDLDKNNIQYYVIPQIRKRTQYAYDIDYLLRAIGEEKENYNDR